MEGVGVVVLRAEESVLVAVVGRAAGLLMVEVGVLLAAADAAVGLVRVEVRGEAVVVGLVTGRRAAVVDAALVSSPDTGCVRDDGLSISTRPSENATIEVQQGSSSISGAGGG